MNLLVDTHALLWYLKGDRSLPSSARRALERRSNLTYVSIASLWEIAIKVSLRKLELGRPYSGVR